ncbi:hypothetical protein BH09SUM1_BH09SUM1_10600 [soil metagenome]
MAATPAPTSKISSILPALILFGLPVIWWWPLLSGCLPDFMDTVAQLYPYRIAVARQLHAGYLPLWLPNQMSGMPLAGNPQVAVWYPLQWIFFILPTPFGNGLVCLLHYWIGGFGAYCAARRLGCLRVAALFAALSFQFGSMMVSRIALTPHLYAVVWIPWMIASIEYAIRRSGGAATRGMLGVSLAFAMQLLAGAPQITFYTVPIIGAYWLARSARCGRDMVRALAFGAVAALVGGMIAGVQFIPTAEFVRNSARAEIAPEELQREALNGSYLWRALVGGTGEKIEDTDSINAIGLGGLLAMPFGFSRRRRRFPVALMLGFGVLSLLLSAGALTPFLLRWDPGFSRFHAPRRALIMWSVIGPLAAGIGFQQIAVLLRRRRAPAFATPGLALVLLLPVAWMLPRLERAFTTGENLKANEQIARIVGGDRFLAIDPTFAYSYNSRRADYGKSLMPNLAAWHGLNDADGYDPLVPKRYAMAADLACKDSGHLYPSHGVFFTDPMSPVLRLFAVGHLLGRFDVYQPSRLGPAVKLDVAETSASVVLERADERWPLFRYREERPNAWAVRRVVRVASPEEALASAVRLGTLGGAAFVEEQLQMPEGSDLPKVVAEELLNGSFTVSLEPPPVRDTLVCVSASWMPGWRARAGSGMRLLTVPADGVIVGVVVPAGVSAFDLSYRPMSFTRGALVTLCGLILFLAIFLRTCTHGSP